QLPRRHTTAAPFPYTTLFRSNPGFQFDARRDGDAVTWHPYDGVPGVLARSNGLYTQDPQWYRGFLYTEERERGQDFGDAVVRMRSEEHTSELQSRFDLVCRLL